MAVLGNVFSYKEDRWGLEIYCVFGLCIIVTSAGSAHPGLAITIGVLACYANEWQHSRHSWMMGRDGILKFGSYGVQSPVTWSQVVSVESSGILYNAKRLKYVVVTATDSNSSEHGGRSGSGEAPLDGDVEFGLPARNVIDPGSTANLLNLLREAYAVSIQVGDSSGGKRAFDAGCADMGGSAAISLRAVPAPRTTKRVRLWTVIVCLGYMACRVPFMRPLESPESLLYQHPRFGLVEGGSILLASVVGWYLLPWLLYRLASSGRRQGGLVLSKKGVGVEGRFFTWDGMLRIDSYERSLTIHALEPSQTGSPNPSSQMKMELKDHFLMDEEATVEVLNLLRKSAS